MRVDPELISKIDTALENIRTQLKKAERENSSLYFQVRASLFRCQQACISIITSKLAAVRCDSRSPIALCKEGQIRPTWLFAHQLVPLLGIVAKSVWRPAQRVPPISDIATAAPASLVAPVLPPDDIEVVDPSWFGFVDGGMLLPCSCSTTSTAAMHYS